MLFRIFSGNSSENSPLCGPSNLSTRTTCCTRTRNTVITARYLVQPLFVQPVVGIRRIRIDPAAPLKFRRCVCVYPTEQERSIPVWRRVCNVSCVCIFPTQPTIRLSCTAASTRRMLKTSSSILRDTRPMRHRKRDQRTDRGWRKGVAEKAERDVDV